MRNQKYESMDESTRVRGCEGGSSAVWRSVFRISGSIRKELNPINHPFIREQQKWVPSGLSIEGRL